MPRKRINPEDKKENITLRLPRYLIDKLREVEGYNNLVEALLKDHFSKK